MTGLPEMIAGPSGRGYVSRESRPEYSLHLRNKMGWFIYLHQFLMTL